MRSVWVGVAAFIGGAVVGGLIVRAYAIKKVEGLAGDAIDTVLGKGSTYGGVAKTIVNMFVEDSG